MRKILFVVVCGLSLQLNAMEAIKTQESKVPSDTWLDLGSMSVGKFNDDFATQREITFIEQNMLDGIKKLIDQASESNGFVSIYELKNLNDKLKKAMFERADNLAKRFDPSCDLIIRIPNKSIDEKWPRIEKAYKKKKLGDSVRLAPVDSQYERRCYIHIPDCINDVKKTREIIAYLQNKLGLHPTEYQPTTYFHLGIRLTRPITELVH